MITAILYILSAVSHTASLFFAIGFSGKRANFARDKGLAIMGCVSFAMGLILSGLAVFS